MEVKPLHNCDALTKTISNEDFQPLYLLPFEKDGTRLGRRNKPEVWMLSQMTKRIFFMTQILAIP